MNDLATLVYNANDLTTAPLRIISKSCGEKKSQYVFYTQVTYSLLSYDVAVFQWITSCHKNRMTTRVITLLREYVTSLTTSVTTI